MKNRVRELRTASGMSQGDLDDALGVSRQTINSIENGRYLPSLPLAFALARSFDSIIEEIFTLRRTQHESDPGRTPRGPAIYRVNRKGTGKPFGHVLRVAAITGFAGAPSISADGSTLYYHQLVGDRFDIESVTRPPTTKDVE